jgi:uncharacterized protein (TIGR04222 family)
MDWLTHNPLAEMYGPVFLAFYAAVVALTVAAVWLGRRALDWTGSMTTPAVPTEPDPFEVAYLRGGENEVARSVIFTLVQKGVLEVRQEGDDFLVAPATATAERRNLSPIERRTLDWFAAPQKVSRIFREDGLAPQLKPFCAAYEQRLRRENFLPTAEMLGGARLLRWAGASVLAGLAAYKILVALSQGRFNVLFLVALAAVGLFLVFRVSKQPRLTGRGRAYLERLQLAFERLKNRPAVAGGPSLLATQPLAPVSNVAGATGGPALAAYDPTLPLLVGVFGVTALAGTQYDYFQQSFRRSAVNGGADGSVGSGCGSSCGSSDSSSDSSSSDGGGSSCGSSCGGGGCGGCGS